jgi:vesicle transport through interaction with t-SNAREs protein 1
MRLEKQNIPSTSRPKINTRLRTYESATTASKSRLASLSTDRAALFSGRYTDEDPALHPNNGGGGGGGPPSDIHLAQRQQLLSSTDRLDRSSQRLRASQALASETEAIGAAALADLHAQRETILHTQGVLGQSEGYVDRSVKTLRGMARRYCAAPSLSFTPFCIIDLDAR